MSPATHPKRLTALADANVFYSNDQRNVLVELAYERVINLRWTDEIEREWVDNLVANNTSVRRENIERTCRLMREHVPDYDVQNYAAHSGATGATDEKDRHVAAAALACTPSVLITWNTRDFDADTLLAGGVTVQDPDEFLCGVFDGKPELVHAAVEKAYGYVRKQDGKPTWSEYLDRLATRGAPASLREFAERLRAFGRADRPEDEPSTGFDV